MLDFRPDLDPRTPDVLTDVTNMIPTDAGYQSAKVATAYGTATLTPAAGESNITSLFATRLLSAAGGIVVVGTNRRLLLLTYSPSAYVDVSKAGNYNLDASTWQYGEDTIPAFDFCAFGDLVIACHKQVSTQVRTATTLSGATKFADLTDGVTPPPKANTCCVARNFVFLGDCATWAGVTGSPDILAWSGVGNHLDWANNAAITQSSYAQFNDTPGAITAVRPFQDGVVVFKANSMYYGRYVGADGSNSLIWDFIRISDKVGCVGHRSVVNIDSALVFVGRDDVYSYDGTRPVSITHGIGKSLPVGAIQPSLYAVRLGHDLVNKSVWLQADNGATIIYVWNYRLDRWGVLAGGAEEIFCQTNVDNFRVVSLASVSNGIVTNTSTVDHFDLYTLTLRANVAYNRGNTAATTYGPTCAFTTGYFGNAQQLSTFSRLSPIFTKIMPTGVASGFSATMDIYKGLLPAAIAAGAQATVTMNSSYRFDNLAIAATDNWFKVGCNFANIGSSPIEIAGYIPTIKPAGSR